MNNTKTYSNYLLMRYRFYHVTDEVNGVTTLPTSIIRDIVLVYADIMHISVKRASAILRKCQIRKGI